MLNVYQACMEGIKQRAEGDRRQIDRRKPVIWSQVAPSEHVAALPTDWLDRAVGRRFFRERRIR